MASRAAIAHPLLERVLERVTRLESACWVWQGADSGNGYGRISVDGKTRAVHILVYEIYIGPVPRGLVLDHDCRNRLCCNPEHLIPRTNLENTLIGEGPTAVNARKTFCKRGHPFVGDNVIERIRNGRIHRECRACKNRRARVGRLAP